MRNQFRLAFIFKIFLVVSIVLLLSANLEAEHISGGQLTYSCVDTDLTDDNVQFKVSCSLFRDVFFGQEEIEDFGVYEQTESNDWIWVSTIENANIVDRFFLPFDSEDSCSLGNPTVEVIELEFDIDLLISDNNYMVAYQRCCRNASINNIVNPGETGIALSVAITPEAQRACDNTPLFNELPTAIICIDENMQIDFSASDPDEDELRYHFCAPRTAGGPNIFYTPYGCDGVLPDALACPPPFEEIVFIDAVGNSGGFTSETPLAGDPVVSIDPGTGMITGIPRQIGNYVVGVCIQSFRDGESISEIVRDFTFTVESVRSSTEKSTIPFTNLYPNPTFGMLTIELPNVISGRLTIRNTAGQSVVDQLIDNTDRLQTNLSGQQSGLYLVELVNEAGDRFLHRVAVF